MQLLKCLRPFLVAITLVAGITQPAKAELVVIQGDTSDSATFQRPSFELNSYSTSASAVKYDVVPLVPLKSGGYSMVAVGDGFDIALFLYRGAFDPNQSLTNAIAANDDFRAWNTSSIVKWLEAGSQYFLVVTGYADTAFGEYALTYASGAPGNMGTPSPVPEPSQWLMMGLGAAVLSVAMRRRKHS